MENQPNKEKTGIELMRKMTWRRAIEDPLIKELCLAFWRLEQQEAEKKFGAEPENAGEGK